MIFLGSILFGFFGLLFIGMGALMNRRRGEIRRDLWFDSRRLAESEWTATLLLIGFVLAGFSMLAASLVLWFNPLLALALGLWPILLVIFRASNGPKVDWRQLMRLARADRGSR